MTSSSLRAIFTCSFRGFLGQCSVVQLSEEFSLVCIDRIVLQVSFSFVKMFAASLSGMCGFITTTNHHGLQNGVGDNKKTEDQDN